MTWRAVCTIALRVLAIPLRTARLVCACAAGVDHSAYFDRNGLLSEDDKRFPPLTGKQFGSVLVRLAASHHRLHSTPTKTSTTSAPVSAKPLSAQLGSFLQDLEVRYVLVFDLQPPTYGRVSCPSICSIFSQTEVLILAPFSSCCHPPFPPFPLPPPPPLVAKMTCRRSADRHGPSTRTRSLRRKNFSEV